MEKENEEKTVYYDGTKLLNKLDLNNEKPSIFLCNSNRSAGKTTFFLKRQLEHFRKTGRKTILLYRNQYEIGSANLIYTDVLRLNPDLAQDEEMTIESRAKGLFCELFLGENSFGYVLYMNNTQDKMKKYSPLFAEVDNVFFDEYQLESGKYLPNEINAFQSILLTIARGGGYQSRYIEVVLCANNVTIMNPYFIMFGIHKRLKSDTKFLRGNGWVAEFSFNESASKAIKENGVYKAFADTSYMNYSTENVYLHDEMVFLTSPSGKCKYLFTILYDGKQYGVREYPLLGIIHVSQKPDKTCKTVLTFKAKDHNQNTMMLNHYSFTWKYLKDAFLIGALRFDNVESKSVIFDILAVDLYK